MTPDQIETERAKFEDTWTEKHGPCVFRRDCFDGYEAQWIDDSWCGWLACAELAIKDTA